jgi:hypothetical protein
VVSSRCCDAVARTLLHLDGGRCAITTKGGMLYVEAKLALSLVLPFKVQIEDIEVLFDEIELIQVIEAFKCEKIEEMRD